MEVLSRNLSAVSMRKRRWNISKPQQVTQKMTRIMTVNPKSFTIRADDEIVSYTSRVLASRLPRAIRRRHHPEARIVHPGLVERVGALNEEKLGI